MILKIIIEEVIIASVTMNYHFHWLFGQGKHVDDNVWISVAYSMRHEDIMMYM